MAYIQYIDIFYIKYTEFFSTIINLYFKEALFLMYINISVILNSRKYEAAITRNGGKIVIRKSNIADKEVPVMLTQRTGYKLDSDGAAYICRFLKSFFFTTTEITGHIRAVAVHTHDRTNRTRVWIKTRSPLSRMFFHFLKHSSASTILILCNR